MTSLPFRLERSIVIGAPRDTVFSFFTDDRRWAAWWGPGSTIDARPGGRVYIRHPDGTEASGEVVEVMAPELIVFTYGFASGKPMPPGASRATIRLEDHERGTRLSLTHEFADESARDEHIQGWRFQLSLFANVVADEVHARAADLVDGWFAAWAETNPDKRAKDLLSIASQDVSFRDQFSLVNGIDDLVPHISAAQRFMPGIRFQSSGKVRHCQGTVLADWIAVAPDGRERARGTNVFVLGVDGRIESVTGLWSTVPTAAG